MNKIRYIYLKEDFVNLKKGLRGLVLKSDINFSYVLIVNDKGRYQEMLDIPNSFIDDYAPNYKEFSNIIINGELIDQMQSYDRNEYKVINLTRDKVHFLLQDQQVKNIFHIIPYNTAFGILNYLENVELNFKDMMLFAQKLYNVKSDEEFNKLLQLFVYLTKYATIPNLIDDEVNNSVELTNKKYVLQHMVKEISTLVYNSKSFETKLVTIINIASAYDKLEHNKKLNEEEDAILTVYKIEQGLAYLNKKDTKVKMSDIIYLKKLLTDCNSLDEITFIYANGNIDEFINSYDKKLVSDDDLYDSKVKPLMLYKHFYDKYPVMLTQVLYELSSVNIKHVGKNKNSEFASTIYKDMSYSYLINKDPFRILLLAKLYKEGIGIYQDKELSFDLVDEAIQESFRLYKGESLNKVLSYVSSFYLALSYELNFEKENELSKNMQLISNGIFTYGMFTNFLNKYLSKVKDKELSKFIYDNFEKIFSMPFINLNGNRRYDYKGNYVIFNEEQFSYIDNPLPAVDFQTAFCNFELVDDGIKVSIKLPENELILIEQIGYYEETDSYELIIKGEKFVKEYFVDLDSMHYMFFDQEDVIFCSREENYLRFNYNLALFKPNKLESEYIRKRYRIFSYLDRKKNINFIAINKDISEEEVSNHLQNLKLRKYKTIENKYFYLDQIPLVDKEKSIL